MDNITKEKIKKIEKYFNLLQKAINGEVLDYAAMLAEDISCEARGLWRHLQKLKEMETGNE